MGFGRAIATAAAATPLLRNFFHDDRARAYPDAERLDYDSTRATPLPVSQLRGDQNQNQHRNQNAAGVSEEMSRRPLLGVDTQVLPQSSRQHAFPGHQLNLGYGATEGSSSLRTSPERYRRESWLDRVPEEATVNGDVDGNEDEDEQVEAEEWDLAQQGYYSGSYKRTVALYTLVPLTSIFLFVLLALIPSWTWPVQYPTPRTLPRTLPSPLPEFILSAALWSLSYLLRVPLYTLSSLVSPRPLDTLLFNTLHVLLSQLLRLAALAMLRVRHEMAFPRPTWRDGAFRTTWWLALGWGLAEAATSIAQGYGQLGLYRNVMVPVDRVREILRHGAVGFQEGSDGSREYMPLSPRSEHSPAQAQTSVGNGGGGVNANGGRRKDGPISMEEAIRIAVDQDVEQLIHLQEREELEEVYGLPVVYIPVFVPCLQRIDSFLFSLGFTLILAWAYLLSPLSFPPGQEIPPIYSSHALAIAFPVVVVVHLFLSLLHSPPILSRIGVHTTAYVGLLVGLGVFFTGLGLWGALS